jgi:type I restriction enzyme M protein
LTTPRGRSGREPRYVIDNASGRLISAGPEETDATQPLLESLINEAGWSADQIVSRPNQWRVVATPSGTRRWPVDVAIFDNPRNLRDSEHVIVICECKRPDVETGIEHAIVYKTATGYEQAPAGTPLPTPADPLTPIGRRVLTYADLRTAPSLVPVFRRIRDRLATMDRNVNRDEDILPDISLLLLLKILDEQGHRLRPAVPLVFQLDATPTQTSRRLRELLQEQVARNPDLFGANGRDIRFQIDDDSVFYVVETLQNYRLLANDTDAVAQAFQVIRGKAYKGEEGQYFTPQSVVRVAISALDPQPEDRIIDPACGSGSFLATALTRVVEHLTQILGPDEQAITSARREWATTKLYAIDKDSVSIRLSKAYLSMLGDGSAHVYKADSIRRTHWLPAIASSIQDGSFDVVVTNPPFGTKLKAAASIGREEAYALSSEWKRVSGSWAPTSEYTERDIGLLFLERSIRLLRPGGRLAIVLPDTYLFSDSYAWLIQWLSQFKITHSINVPIEAFEPHCRAKTSVIVLRNEPASPGHRIIGSLCETFGEDKHGRPRFRFIDGKLTDARDDEMNEAAQLLQQGSVGADTKLSFRFPQEDAMSRGVLVASYWWRRPYLDAILRFAEENDCELISIGDLIDQGELLVMDGHGSPSSHFKGRGPVPYVKVVDIKNWRINENPEYFMPEDVAAKYRRGKTLHPYDLVTPTRASKNIGLFAVVMPWQTQVILTREITIWRVASEATRIDPWLLMALMSLRVVHDQFKFLVLMQMNREDLGRRYRELLIPLPRDEDRRQAWAQPIRDYFEAVTKARASYDALASQLDPRLFADRP